MNSGDIGYLKGRLSSQRLYGIIGHAVSNDQNIFHKVSPLWKSYDLSIFIIQPKSGTCNSDLQNCVCILSHSLDKLWLISI